MSPAEIVLWGVPLGPVTLILIANAIMLFVVTSLIAIIVKLKGKSTRSYAKYYLFWVFLFFALFSSAPVFFGVDSSNVALIVGTIILLAVFVPGLGTSKIKRNFVVLIVAILGSIVGYVFAKIFVSPILMR
jgi:hypothetical protein